MGTRSLSYKPSQFDDYGIPESDGTDSRGGIDSAMCNIAEQDVFSLKNERPSEWYAQTDEKVNKIYRDKKNKD